MLTTKITTTKNTTTFSFGHHLIITQGLAPEEINRLSKMSFKDLRLEILMNPDIIVQETR